MPLLHVINVCLLSPVCASWSHYATPPPLPFPFNHQSDGGPPPWTRPCWRFPPVKCSSFPLSPSAFSQGTISLLCSFSAIVLRLFHYTKWMFFELNQSCEMHFPPIQASPFVKLTMAFAHKNRSGSGKIPHGLDHSLTPAAKRWVSTAMSANAYPQPVGKVCWSPSEWYFTGI